MAGLHTQEERHNLSSLILKLVIVSFDLGGRAFFMI